MFISEFVIGIVSVLGIEILAIVGYATYLTIRDMSKNWKNNK